MSGHRVYQPPSGGPRNVGGAKIESSERDSLVRFDEDALKPSASCKCCRSAGAELGDLAHGGERRGVDADGNGDMAGMHDSEPSRQSQCFGDARREVVWVENCQRHLVSRQCVPQR